MAVRACVFSLVITGIVLSTQASELDRTRPVVGLRSNPPTVTALMDARIVVGPGHVIERGTIVVRDRLIETVGADVDIPAEARRIDHAGRTIYPGLIDAYAQIEIPRLAEDRQLGHWNKHVQPERLVSDVFDGANASDAACRKQGITARLLAPKRGIIKGRSAVVSLADGPAGQRVLAPRSALHLRLGAPRDRERGKYPSSPMGAVALARQTFHDALWYRDAWRVLRARNDVAPPERNLALETLQPYVDEQALVVIETADEQYLQRAELFAREFGLRVAFVGSGQEYRNINAVKQSDRWIIVPLAFPEPPNVATVEAAAEVSLERLMHWDHAPENPARLEEAGIPIAFTSHGLKDVSKFLPSVRQAVERGLDADAALRALTTTPARELKLSHLIGSVKPGRLAHLVVTDGDLFDQETKIVETWVDGQSFVLERPSQVDLRGRWQLTMNVGENGNPLKKPIPALVIDGQPGELDGRFEIKADDAASHAQGDEEAETSNAVELKSMAFQAYQLTAQFSARPITDSPGVAQLSLSAIPNDSKTDPMRLVGRIVLPDASILSVSAKRIAAHDESESASTDTAAAGVSGQKNSGEEQNHPGRANESTVDPPTEDKLASESADADAPKSKCDSESKRASFPVNYPLGAFGVTQPPKRHDAVVFRQATVWTCDDSGRLMEKADVLVDEGVIQKIAEQINDVPDSALVIDCTDRHLTPGIIDCHSHMATDGGVNEGSQAITAEVRIGDFVDARDISIYRQLAGGVTTANILHGSANPIGGQNQVIKLRWGTDPETMKFREAPAGIKFALGENVKQSNGNERFPARYPYSRMGVEQIIRDAFLAARQYQHRHQQWKEYRRGLPPRRDLELDAILQIQNGERWIHCHSYRQDEILALLRTLEDFGIQIGTLQHILEGYKVADVLKRHGAMASSFSDWWAYKFEVYDAIPFNGSLMHDRGIVVSFNSDDAELARHLNHEAAKAVKYGGVSEVEALKFVTLNPARQLRIDSMIGSIEVGKHADLVVWSGPPLSAFSRCEQTWIDGRRYFHLERDRQLRERVREQRAVLTQKILDSGETMVNADEAEVEERDLWPRFDIHCRASR